VIVRRRVLESDRRHSKGTILTLKLEDADAESAVAPGQKDASEGFFRNFSYVLLA
jgi:hypothetical protein